MAKPFRMTIKGDKELLDKIAKMGTQISGVIEDAALTGAEEFKERANNLAPGPHIETDTVKKTKTFAEVEIGPDEEHWYYRFFETGTAPHEFPPDQAGGLELMGIGELIVRMIVHHPGMPAQPFLRPAFDEKRKDAGNKTGDRFLEVINKHVEK